MTHTRSGVCTTNRLVSLEAVASRLEGIAIRFFLLFGWRPGLNLYVQTSLQANMPDNVSEYFGAHVAAFFHLYNAFTRCELGNFVGKTLIKR